MSTIKIFSSNEIDVYFSKGNSEFLLITFSAICFKSVSETFWGESFSKKNDISVIGFVSRTGTNWYPRKDVELAAKEIEKISRKYIDIITYGSSMGAYGALKHSALLGATACAAFGAQFSIDPLEVDNVAFTRFYRHDVNENMSIKAGDICKNAYVFYDPHFEFDRINANVIANTSPNVSLVKIPYAGHECIKVIAGATTTLNLLKSCLSGDSRSISHQVRSARKASAAHFVGLSGHLLARRPELAFKVLKSSPYPIDKKQESTFYHQAAVAESSRKNFDEAEIYILKAIDILPERTGFIRTLAAIHEHKNDDEKAIGCLHRVLKIDQHDPIAMFMLAKIYFRTKDLSSAHDFINKALDLQPDKGPFLMLSEQIKKGLSTVTVI